MADADRPRLGDDMLVFVHDLEGVCQYASPASAGVLGRRPEELVGQATARIVHRDDRSLLLDAAFDLASTDRERVRTVLRVEHRNGHHVTLEAHHEAVRDAEGVLQGFRTTATVVPAMTLREPGTPPRPPASAALYDATGAATVALLDDRLQQAAQRQRRTGEPFAVLWVRLHLDHPDPAVTRIAARRLIKLVRRTDTVACIGERDLAVVCVGASVDVAMSVAERAVASLAEPVGTGGRRRTLQSTVGVAPAAPPVRDPQALLRAAEGACCDPTRAGEGPVRLAS